MLLNHFTHFIRLSYNLLIIIFDGLLRDKRLKKLITK